MGVEVVWDEQTDRKKSLGSNNDNRDDDNECGNDDGDDYEFQPSEDVDVEIEVPTWLIFGAS